MSIWKSKNYWKYEVCKKYGVFLDEPLGRGWMLKAKKAAKSILPFNTYVKFMTEVLWTSRI